MQVKKKYVFLVASFIAVLMLAGCQTNKPKMSQTGALPEVAVITIQPQRVVLTSELPARTSAYLVAEVRPQVNGIIQKCLFTEGSDVHAGEILYQIDPAPYRAAYNSAVAALARAESNLPPARLRAERYQKLLADKAVSQQEYDDAAASVKQIEADIQCAKAAVETARINLDYTEVKSPITGRAGKSNVTVGALATAYQGIAFTTIQQIDPIYVDASQSTADLLQLRRDLSTGRLKNGRVSQTRVKLILEDGTPYALTGTLKFSDITVDRNTGSITLRMVFPNPKGILLPGMYVRAIVERGIVEQGILVPQQAVSRDAKGIPSVMVVNNENKVEQRILVADETVGTNWLIRSGLKAGDRVIVEGLLRVRPGSPVKTVPYIEKEG
ncbi:MAG: Multidrug resistance protein MexA precursor [candidate division TA06 bacterium ADurb.Bin131]|uniref:Multidrug resistance protein MexA n=1 Tax=candidate division TA06 bacterium ADurb.Bin131 TaxID=1852827 RepID=A0A1V6CF24_UNCT6|nr:MAG: Multidrug resistance protein MexA precursor [candidate division TA06 bacterium ADurb.Bin131]